MPRIMKYVHKISCIFYIHTELQKNSKKQV